MSDDFEKQAKNQTDNPTVSPYLLRPARTLEEYLRERRGPAEMLAKFDANHLRDADEL